MPTDKIKKERRERRIIKREEHKEEIRLKYDKYKLIVDFSNIYKAFRNYKNNI